MAQLDFSRAVLPAEQAEFVGLFLRFEFALKEAGFVPENGKAEVRWGEVCKALGDGFFRRIEDSGNARTTLQSPAKKQISRNFQLEWEQQNAPTNTTQLIEAVRRVRNNVLHGGKSGDPEGEQVRSAKLVAEAKYIVESAILNLEAVRGSFEGNY